MNNISLKIKRDTLKKLVFVVMFIFCFSGYALSQKSGFGMGVMFGEPTGISFKGWLSESTAIDGGVGWSFVNDGSIHIHADYLFHFNNVLGSQQVPLYIGVGGRIKLKNEEHHNDSRIGIRVPFGIAFQLVDAPVDIFLEIAPILDLTPETKGSVNGALGIRYYFNK